MMNPLLLLTAFMTVLPSALASPAPILRRDPGSILPRDTLHDCGVFIQRWWDSSFDIYIYNSSDTSEPFLDFDYIQTVESVALTPPEQLPVTTLGSYQLLITDVANPVDNDDPGKLSFAWGTETWDSWTGSQCTVIPVGDWGARSGYPTNTSCTFQCNY